MMLNSRFELSKIEKNTRVEREICLATLENREWKENLFLPLSKIESRQINGDYQIFEIERNFSFYYRFFSRERDSCQCLVLGSFCHAMTLDDVKIGGEDEAVDQSTWSPPSQACPPRGAEAASPPPRSPSSGTASSPVLINSICFVGSLMNRPFLRQACKQGGWRGWRSASLSSEDFSWRVPSPGRNWEIGWISSI